MRPIIDPGYGESLLQGDSEAQMQHEERVRQHRAEAMRKVKEVLAADPPQPVPTRWSDVLLFEMTLVLVFMVTAVIGLLLLLTSIASLVASSTLVIAVPIISAIHMWIRLWRRHKPVSDRATNPSPKEEDHA